MLKLAYPYFIDRRGYGAYNSTMLKSNSVNTLPQTGKANKYAKFAGRADGDVFERLDYIEQDAKLNREPELPPAETVEEFLARGGNLKKCRERTQFSVPYTPKQQQKKNKSHRPSNRGTNRPALVVKRRSNGQKVSVSKGATRAADEFAQ